MEEILIEENKKIKELIKRYQLWAIIIIVLMFLIISVWAYFSFSYKKIFENIKAETIKKQQIIKTIKIKDQKKCDKKISEVIKKISTSKNKQFEKDIISKLSFNNYILYSSKTWKSVVIKKEQLKKLLNNKKFQNLIKNKQYSIFIKSNVTDFDSFIKKVLK